MITWIYPERCPVCLRIVTPKGAMFHPKCEKYINVMEGPVCLKCGMPLSSEEKEYCNTCENQPDRGWDRGSSLFPYHGTMGNALRMVKKDGRTELVRFFAEQIKENKQAFLKQTAPECIVPVPLHPSKQRMRGFNQAELLAEALGTETGIPVRCLLKKNKKTKDQKSLSKNQRIRNVKDAFAVDEELLNGQVPASVLLVDDVTTTGSTLSACAAALKAKGVVRVAFLSVCVAEQLE